MNGSPTITFASLIYDVSTIENLIVNTPNIDAFVFAFYFPESGNTLQLVSYAHLGQPADKYIPEYDILEVYEKGQALTAPGPFKMCDNTVSAADMQTLIAGTGGNKPDFLIFSPQISDTGYIYYEISTYQNSVGSGKPRRLHGDGDDIFTNPSPPAT
jgi:hypothetical protein